MENRQGLLTQSSRLDEVRVEECGQSGIEDKVISEHLVKAPPSESPESDSFLLKLVGVGPDTIAQTG